MSVQIRLLGCPCAWRDGVKVGLRGHKAWLLLALLALEDAPVGRGRLARMLFVDATDPAASLRWNLSQLRRSLGLHLDGDPVVLGVPADVAIDVDLLLHGHADDAAGVSGLNDELLAGVRVEATSELMVWLEDERRHVHRLGVNVRQEAALTQLGRGDADAAVTLARQVAESSPLDENAAALFVRCLRAAGDIAEARAVAERAAARLRDQLGVEPTDQLWAAVAAPPGGDRRVTGRGAVIAQLEAGASAVDAGAADTGIAALRSAVVAARAVREPALLARALVALGSAMIHSVRGVDQEGLALLHEAVPLTATVDDAVLAASARREIGYVDFLRGRYDRAFHWFDQARLVGDGATTEIGWVDAYAGTSRDDVGDIGRRRECSTARCGPRTRYATRSWRRSRCRCWDATISCSTNSTRRRACSTPHCRSWAQSTGPHSAHSRRRCSPMSSAVAGTSVAPARCPSTRSCSPSRSATHAGNPPPCAASA